MSHDVTHTRPFNAEHAKAGAPYCCADGAPAKIEQWQSGIASRMVGAIVRDNNFYSVAWKNDGSLLMHEPLDTDCLVMLPLGFVEGKPVFVGDEFIFGSQIITALPRWRQGSLLGCTWPQPATTEEPAKVSYPVFIGDESILDSAYDNTSPDTKGWSEALIRVANAAIRHAIDSQQVVAVPLDSGWLNPDRTAELRQALAESKGQLAAARGEVASLQKQAYQWERIANETDESLCKVRGELASTQKELTEAKMAVANYKAVCEGMESDAIKLRAAYRSMFEISKKACRTLRRHGFTDNGGEEWKPPIGYAPGQKQEMEREIARLTDALVCANSDAAEWKGKYDAADGANTMLSRDLGAANTKVSEWRNNYMDTINSLQWAHTTSKVMKYSLAGDHLGEALHKTVQGLTGEVNALATAKPVEVKHVLDRFIAWAQQHNPILSLNFRTSMEGGYRSIYFPDSASQTNWAAFKAGAGVQP